MKTVATNAFAGILSRTRYEFYVGLHVKIGSYYVDQSEQKHVLGVKHSNHTPQVFLHSLGSEMPLHEK